MSHETLAKSWSVSSQLADKAYPTSRVPSKCVFDSLSITDHPIKLCFPSPQILQNWRTKRVIDPQKVDDVMQILFTRQTQATEASTPGPAPPPNKSSEPHLSRGEIFKRIEEDRERHKRLRERRWVQTQAQSLPSSTVSGHAVAYNPYGLASFLPLSDTENAEVALDIEFENEWEATSDWNEDDVEAIMDERELCYPHLRKKGADGTDIDDGGGEEPMDLS